MAPSPPSVSGSNNWDYDDVNTIYCMSVKIPGLDIDMDDAIDCENENPPTKKRPQLPSRSRNASAISAISNASSFFFGGSTIASKNTYNDNMSIDDKDDITQENTESTTPEQREQEYLATTTAADDRMLQRKSSMADETCFTNLYVEDNDETPNYDDDNNNKDPSAAVLSPLSLRLIQSTQESESFKFGVAGGPSDIPASINFAPIEISIPSKKLHKFPSKRRLLAEQQKQQAKNKNKQRSSSKPSVEKKEPVAPQLSPEELKQLAEEKKKEHDRKVLQEHRRRRRKSHADATNIRIATVTKSGKLRRTATLPENLKLNASSNHSSSRRGNNRRGSYPQRKRSNRHLSNKKSAKALWSASAEPQVVVPKKCQDLYVMNTETGEVELVQGPNNKPTATPPTRRGRGRLMQMVKAGWRSFRQSSRRKLVVDGLEAEQPAPQEVHDDDQEDEDHDDEYDEEDDLEVEDDCSHYIREQKEQRAERRFERRGSH